MAKLSIAILGLDRIGASIGLRLKHYMAKGGKHQFEIVGYDNRDDFEKAAQKLKAIDRTEHKAFDAVADTDLVIINLPYEEVKAAYELIAPDLRDGVVILDASPIKQASMKWSEKYLTDEHHVVGFTPIINPEYMFDPNESTERATDDMFVNSTIYLTPSATCIKEAVDLAVNFSTILGGSPHFLDPAEHDSLTTMTEELPSLLSVAMYYTLMKHNAWTDAQRMTNPAFNVLTRYLFTHHPDGLRDAWSENHKNLTRSVDDLINTLKTLRTLLYNDDVDAIEAFLIESSDEYQKWVNKRHNGDWDEKSNPKVDIGDTIAGSILGGTLSRKLFGDRDKKDS